MRTTVALRPRTRDELKRLQHAWSLPSIEAVINRLVSGMPLGARALYDARADAVTRVLARHHINKLVAFGSRARGDARPDSDLDLAAALPSGATLMSLANLEADLSDAFGLDVHVTPLADASGELAATILHEGVVLFAEG